jgi:hypothetical protein
MGTIRDQLNAICHNLLGTKYEVLPVYITSSTDTNYSISDNEKEVSCYVLCYLASDYYISIANINKDIKLGKKELIAKWYEIRRKGDT